MSEGNNYYSLSVQSRENDFHYFVTIKDIHGIKHEIEVDEDIFRLYESFNKEERHQQYESRKYIEHISVSDEELHQRAFHECELTDDFVFSKLEIHALYEAIAKLSGLQRKRFILYFEDDLTYKQIAQIENCSVTSVKRSIDRARRFIIDELKKT